MRAQNLKLKQKNDLLLSNNNELKNQNNRLNQKLQFYQNQERDNNRHKNYKK